MPTPHSIRTVVLKSSYSAATVSDLDVAMNATFTTTWATTTKFEDASASGAEETTKYRMKFANASGAEIGVITLRLVGKGNIDLEGLTIAKTVVRSEIDPTPGKGGVTMIESPNASFERIWKQAAIDGDGKDAVDNVAKLDMRVSQATGYTVGQTVQTQTDGQLVIAYDWLDANGVSRVSGTVTLGTSVTAGSGYTLGPIRVTDNNPTTGEARRR